jgi:hypothetical protein
MSAQFAHPPFGITHPLGLPRPIDIDNFFGARLRYFTENIMPIPGGCLAYFDTDVYRPYAQGLVEALQRLEQGWSGPALAEDPARYCLLRYGVPERVRTELALELPDPPRVTLEQVLTYFDTNHVWAPPMQLLDVLTLVSEDLGAEKFAAATVDRPWMAEYMR